MDNALFDITQGVQPNPKFFAVFAQRLDLNPRGGLGNGLVNVDSGGVVVFGSNRQIRAAHPPACDAKPIKSLGAGDFVNEVEIDIDKVGFSVVASGDKVVIP